MRFEHDTYDVDVYSLCESVYYSCNNDEYNYVLECVNDWIYNGYNDNILLEDVLNELNYASLEKFAKAKGWEHNGFNFDNYKISKNRPDEKNYDDNYDLQRFNAIKARLAIRDAKRKGITHTLQLHNARITGQDRQRFSSSLGRSAEETDEYRDRAKKESKSVRDSKRSYLRTIISKYGYPITEKDLRQGGFFKHFTASSLLSHDRDERDKAKKFIDNLRSAKYKKDHPEPPKQEKPSQAPPSPKQQESDPLRAKQGQPAEVKPNTPTPQQPPSSPKQEKPSPKQQESDPLRAKQGQPAEVKPNTPTPQQPPSSPKQEKPSQAPPSPKPLSNESGNQNTNNKSGLKTWQKGAIGAGAAAAVGAGIYAYNKYRNKPKSVIAKRIAALRGIYRKFMVNAQRNPQKAGIFKRIAAKILSVIDKLMSFMQHATDSR